MKTTSKKRLKNEFLRLRIDAEAKNRLDKLCTKTKRRKSDLVREALFEYFVSKHLQPEESSQFIR